MNKEEGKLNKLAGRIDELLLIMSQVSEDLKTVSESLRSIAVSQSTKPRSPTPKPLLLETQERKETIEDVRMILPQNLEDLLSFEEKEDYIIIKPRQFLGSENFAKVASAVRGMQGEYISAGRDSHFRVPRKKEVDKEPST